MQDECWPLVSFCQFFLIFLCENFASPYYSLPENLPYYPPLKACCLVLRTIQHYKSQWDLLEQEKYVLALEDCQEKLV